MLSPRVEELLNSQIQKEFFSAYLYLSMSAYLASQALNGYAHWFNVQAQEERDHALILYNYVLRTGGRVRLGAIEQPKSDFAGVEEVLAETLKHEEFVTASIYNVVDAATQEKDFKTVQTLNWFVNEQVEEEENANDNLSKFRMMGQDGRGLYLLDQAMSTRVYVQASPLAAGAQA